MNPKSGEIGLIFEVIGDFVKTIETAQKKAEYQDECSSQMFHSHTVQFLIEQIRSTCSCALKIGFEGSNSNTSDISRHINPKKTDIRITVIILLDIFYKQLDRKCFLCEKISFVQARYRNTDLTSGFLFCYYSPFNTCSTGSCFFHDKVNAYEEKCRKQLLDMSCQTKKFTWKNKIISV
ncbi:hypothetical protein BpHYR1_018725 [Brachionus plicatilis]|uniref:Uncharacterized protein n=1 Tax=Brachionus plicatilis TaxID=10195 RepID=A0A3M7S513_BRAPC|nr:hypothetical protein BpHYR1_018725 [Brachionus plicatilis]